MKIKLMTILCCAMLVICGGGILLLNTGCGEKEYNLSNIKFNDASENYNGTAHTIELDGQLPDGLKVEYEYYTDEACTEEAENTVDADEYWVKAVFTPAKGFKTPKEMKAKLVVNKVYFGDEVEFTITAENAQFTDPVKAKDNGDGTLYFEANGSSFDKYVITNNQEGATQEKTGFIDADHNISGEAEITTYGQAQYFVVTLEDKNHFKTPFELQVHIERKTFEIRNYEDLTLIYSHIYGGTHNGEAVEQFSDSARKDFRYLLIDDIDCNGEIWKSIGSEYNDGSFTGEFNGNGHTISRFKLNINSVSNKEAPNGLFVSFFGNAHDCDIHDVIFEDCDAEIKKGDYDRITGSYNPDNPLYVSFVVGRLEGGGLNGKEASNLQNITVRNCNIRTDAYKQYIAGIVALDQVNNGAAGVRENLNVENCNIYAISTTFQDRITIGGIVSNTKIQSGTGKIVYNNCNVKNLKIGMDYESWVEADLENKEKYVSLGNSYTGAFAGEIRVATTFENCSLENYLIATQGNTGYYGNLTSGDVEIKNCTHLQDPNWNNFTGVYDLNGKRDEADLNWGEN